MTFFSAQDDEMRRTTPSEPSEPIEPAPPLSQTIKGLSLSHSSHFSLFIRDMHLIEGEEGERSDDRYDGRQAHALQLHRPRTMVAPERPEIIVTAVRIRFLDFV